MIRQLSRGPHGLAHGAGWLGSPDGGVDGVGVLVISVGVGTGGCGRDEAEEIGSDGDGADGTTVGVLLARAGIDAIRDSLEF